MESTRTGFNRRLAMLALAAWCSGCQVVPPVGSSAPAADSTTATEQAVRRDLRARCASYADGLATLLRSLYGEMPGLSGETLRAAELIEAYYTGVLAAASLVLAKFPAELPAQVQALADLKDQRNEAEDRVETGFANLAPDVLDWAFAEIAREQTFYDEHLAPELKGRFVENHAVRADLFRRKYFSGDEDDKGNFLEAYINSRLPFAVSTELPTRPEEDPWYRTRGVSHLETTLRLEPLMIFENGDENLALFGTFGMVYHFFPDYAPQLFDPNPRESFLSGWIQRVGLRIGAGAQDRTSEGVDFVYGAGLQVRSFTLWGTHNPEESEFGFGVGISDLEWLKGAIPVWK